MNQLISAKKHQRKGFDIEMEPIMSPKNKDSTIPPTFQVQPNPFIPISQPIPQNPYLPTVSPPYAFQPSLQPLQTDPFYQINQNLNPFVQNSTQTIPTNISVIRQSPVNPTVSDNYFSSVFTPSSVQVTQTQLPKLYPTIAQEPIVAVEKNPLSLLQEPQKKKGQRKNPKSTERSDSQIKEQSITKRCLRCYQYYTEQQLAQSENKTPCRYHPGTFKRAYSSPLLAGAAIVYWTCCKSGNQNEPGCKHGEHKEDPQMTQVQLAFAKNIPDKPTPQVGVLIDIPFCQSTDIKDSTENKPVIEVKIEKKPKSVIRHYVTDADTLIGLSFRYGVSVKSIRQLNKMPSNDVQAYSRLFIPRKGYTINMADVESDDEDKNPPKELTEAERVLFEKRMLQRLRGQTGMSMEEATYYLSLYGYSYTEAMKEYKDDLEFEKNTPFVPFAKKCK